jgi:DNA-binding transcriptional regulator YhcF (GntR family)
VFWAVNERLNVKQQVMRAICHDIARGALLPGNTIPSPAVLSEERLLNPRVVEAAYANLVELGVLCDLPESEHQVSVDAPRLAREYLLQWAREEMRVLVDNLRSARMTKEEIQNALRTIFDA